MSAVAGASADAASVAPSAAGGDPAAAGAAAQPIAAAWLKLRVAEIAFPGSVECTAGSHAGQTHRTYFTTPGCGYASDPKRQRLSKCVFCCIRQDCIECRVRLAVTAACPLASQALARAECGSTRAVATAELLRAGWHVAQAVAHSGSTAVSQTRLSTALNNVFGAEVVAAVRASLVAGAPAAAAAAASNIAMPAPAGGGAPSIIIDSSAAGSGADVQLPAAATGQVESTGCSHACAASGCGSWCDHEYIEEGYAGMLDVYKNSVAGVQRAIEHSDDPGVCEVDETRTTDGYSYQVITITAPAVLSEDGVTVQKPRVSAPNACPPLPSRASRSC